MIISGSSLRARGAREIFIPRPKDYELTHEAEVARLYRDANPNLVINLTAEVGGIGAIGANKAERASQIKAIESCDRSLLGYRTPCQLVSSV